MQGIATEREHLAAIVQNLNAGLLLLDPRGRVVLTNPSFRRFFGVGEDSSGRLLAELVRQPELLQAAEEARDLRRPRQVEFQLVGPRHMFVEASILPLEQPSFRGVLALFYDVTRQERIERMRKDFVANASHELRTPVTSISACAESLLGDPQMPATQHRRFLEMILRNAARLARLGQDLLELARAEDDRARFHPEATRVSEVLDRVEADVAEALAQRSQRIERDLAPEAGHPFVDPEALERILANLLENAIRFSPEGDTIVVRSRPAAPGRVLLEVEDHGEGIAPIHLSRIFERFYRVDRARSRPDGGTGLGLAIVKHLAESQGGRVSASSQPGVRTLFSLELPTSPAL